MNFKEVILRSNDLIEVKLRQDLKYLHDGRTDAIISSGVWVSPFANHLLAFENRYHLLVVCRPSFCPPPSLASLLPVLPVVNSADWLLFSNESCYLLNNFLHAPHQCQLLSFHAFLHLLFLSSSVSLKIPLKNVLRNRANRPLVHKLVRRCLHRAEERPKQHASSLLLLLTYSSSSATLHSWACLAPTVLSLLSLAHSLCCCARFWWIYLNHFRVDNSNNEIHSVWLRV